VIETQCRVRPQDVVRASWERAGVVVGEGHDGCVWRTRATTASGLRRRPALCGRDRGVVHGRPVNAARAPAGLAGCRHTGSVIAPRLWPCRRPTYS